MGIKDYYTLIHQDAFRNDRFLHLTANEPLLSKTARVFIHSELGDRYFMGGGDEDSLVDFKTFTFLGLPGVAKLVSAAESATKEMLGAAEVNLSCLSGIHAMICAILSTTEPKDTIMSMSVKQGGHIATKNIIERTGRFHAFAPYNPKTFSFDIKKLTQSFKKIRAKALYIDAAFYLSPPDIKGIREAIGDQVLIIYDASHTLGLIMGKQFQNPFKEGADVICANTHKTLPGPQKGIVAFRDKRLGMKANSILNGGLFSSPHTSSMIALSTTILEMQKFGETYARQTITNSNVLGKELSILGYNLRKANNGHYSENHQIHIESENIGHYHELNTRLIKNNISVNFGNPLGGKMLIRLGTQEVTRRGMKEPEMKKIASFLHRSFTDNNCGFDVTKFVRDFKKVHYSFDTL